MSRIWYTSELRRLSGNFARLADWFEHDPDEYDADTLAIELEALGLLDPELWQPTAWVIDAIVAGRCEHEHCVLVDSGYRIGIICCGCAWLSFDGTFEDVPSGDNGDGPSEYPEGANFELLMRLHFDDITWATRAVIGAINGARDAMAWRAHLARAS
jgi:hypothetical protein